MFKKIILTIFLAILSVSVCLPAPVFAAVKKAKVPVVRTDLNGRFVVQESDRSKLWYINPNNKERYLIRNLEDLSLVVDLFKSDIPAADFKKIPKKPNQKLSKALQVYLGKFFSYKDAIYYFNPGDNLAYKVESAKDFWPAAKALAAGASDKSIVRLALNKRQLTYDPLGSSLAYVKYDGVNFVGGKNSQQILPLASLSKVMTAMVFLDTDPDFNKVVEITPEEIRYPCTLQACGSTSEVDLKVGDKIRIHDLWISMLTASSNQSAKILADNSGLAFEEFVARMNKKAESLGLKKTKFVEPAGLSPDNISTAEDFAKLSFAAFNDARIVEGTSYVDYSFDVEAADGSLRTVNVKNRNYSLLAFGPQASKTGYLIEAQRNSSIKKDNAIIVVLHALSMGERNGVIKKLIDNAGLSLAQ